MIYLLRHGETVWNTLGRFQGQKDSPLTKQGVEQADSVAKMLHRELAEDLHSFEMQVSPLGRARETANRIQRLLPLVAVENAQLAEVTVGSWDGMTKFEIDAEYPGVLDGSDFFDWYFRSPDGKASTKRMSVQKHGSTPFNARLWQYLTGSSADWSEAFMQVFQSAKCCSSRCLKKASIDFVRVKPSSLTAHRQRPLRRSDVRMPQRVKPLLQRQLHNAQSPILTTYPGRKTSS